MKCQAEKGGLYGRKKQRWPKKIIRHKNLSCVFLSIFYCYSCSLRKKPCRASSRGRFHGESMNSYLVLTAIGPDRPGLVDEISAFLASKKINIEESRMAVLGGEFAVILLASGEPGIVDRFGAEFNALQKNTGLSIQIKHTKSPRERTILPSMPHRLEATSMDHPGIVHDITSILHKRNINIESMETRVTNAPLSGAPIFKMKCIINIPVGEKPSSIRRELEKLGDRMDIDIEMDAIDSYD